MINPLKFVSKIFKSTNQRELDRLLKITENINSLEKEVKKLTDAEFPKKTNKLQKFGKEWYLLLTIITKYAINLKSVKKNYWAHLTFKKGGKIHDIKQ